MAAWSNLAGTVTGFLRLGLTGVRLKNEAGALAVRNAGDTAAAGVVGAASDDETTAGLSRRNTTTEAQAGTLDAGHMTPLKTKQLINKLSETYVTAEGTTQSIPAATFTALIFPTETEDALGEYNPTTGVFTPQSSGLYMVWVSAESVTAVVDQRVLISMATTAGSDGARVLNGYTSNAASLNISACRPVKLVGGTAYYLNMYCANAQVLSGGGACAMAIKRLI